MQVDCLMLIRSDLYLLNSTEFPSKFTGIKASSFLEQSGSIAEDHLQIEMLPNSVRNTVGQTTHDEAIRLADNS